jgi:hypothetical protein
MADRISGVCFLKVDAEQIPLKGSFSYGLGAPTREGLVGPDAIHGFKEMPTVPFIEGQIVNTKDIDLVALSKIVDATLTLELANGKVVALRNSWITNADGLKGDTEEGSVEVRFEGLSAEEVK